MTKRIIAIGGGEIKSKTTLEIDRYVADLAKKHAGEKRANALFIGTASHDSMPYFNSFRKTYTSVFDIKAEVALMVYGEMSVEKIQGKIEAADCIYIGGGDTIFMLEKWKEFGIDKMLIDAYNQGKIICGLSAGAICWFENIYTDSDLVEREGAYSMQKGLGWLDGRISPHYNERVNDFDEVMLSLPKGETAYGIENLAALEFVNGKLTRAINGGGKAYFIENNGEKLIKTIIE